jgi:hypothetical protein
MILRFAWSPGLALLRYSRSRLQFLLRGLGFVVQLYYLLTWLKCKALSSKRVRERNKGGLIRPVICRGQFLPSLTPLLWELYPLSLFSQHTVEQYTPAPTYLCLVLTVFGKLLIGAYFRLWGACSMIRLKGLDLPSGTSGVRATCPLPPQGQHRTFPAYSLQLHPRCSFFLEEQEGVVGEIPGSPC